MNKLWRMPFIFLLLANGILFMGFEMLVPTLPLFVDHIGGQASQVGIVTGIFVISAILVRPFTNTLAYLYNKKHLVMIGLLICSLATAGYYLTDEIWQLILIRALHGLGYGLASTFLTTLVLEYIPANRLGEGLGYFGAGETVMMSVGPMLGILLLEALDYHYFFYTVAFILLVTVAFIIFIPYKKTKTMNEKPRFSFKFFDRRLYFQVFLGVLMGVATGAIMSFFALYAIEKSFEYVGLFFFVVAIAGLAIRLVSGKIYDRFGPFIVMIVSGALAIIGFGLLVTANSTIMFILAGVFYGAGIGANFPAIQTWTVQSIDNHEHETAVSSFFNAFDIGMGGGSILLGLIVQVTNQYQTVYYVALAVYIVFLLALFFYMKKTGRGILNN